MTDNERELIDTIRNSKNPEEALKIAVTIILTYSEQHESSAKQVLDDLRPRS